MVIELDKKQGLIKNYSINDIKNLSIKHNITIDLYTIEKAKLYFDMRADLINNVVQHNLMNADEAKEEFQSLYHLYKENNFQCKLPMNNQKGDMKQIAFFTAIINIITEDTIRNSSIYDGNLGFDDDPRGLIYVLNEENHIIIFKFCFCVFCIFCSCINR